MFLLRLLRLEEKSGYEIYENVVLVLALITDLQFHSVFSIQEKTLSVPSNRHSNYLGGYKWSKKAAEDVGRIGQQCFPLLCLFSGVFSFGVFGFWLQCIGKKWSNACKGRICSYRLAFKKNPESLNVF